MQDEIGSYEAKTKLPEILRRVEAGETITITNRGKPIADIMPSRSAGRRRARSAIDNILKARTHVVPDNELAEMKEDGRK